MKLNATAKLDFTGTCGHRISRGERCQMYRERALSYREAMHAGTMYPRRYRCAACVATRDRACEELAARPSQEGGAER